MKLRDIIFICVSGDIEARSCLDTFFCYRAVPPQCRNTGQIGGTRPEPGTTLNTLLTISYSEFLPRGPRGIYELTLLSLKHTEFVGVHFGFLFVDERAFKVAHKCRVIANFQPCVLGLAQIRYVRPNTLI